MSFIGVAIGGSALSAGLGYLGATKAADTQAQSANNALQFQEQVYNQNQPRFAAANTAFGNAQTNTNNAFGTAQGQNNNAFATSSAAFQPWITTGQNANYTLGQLMGGGSGKPDYSSFFNSPDYNFAQQQGQRGVIAGANAQGVGLSGGTLKDLATFNSGLASQQYGNYFNRLMGLSQAGQSAASGLSTAASNYANTGASLASNYSNTSANIAGGIGNLATGAANSNNTMASNVGNTMQGVGQAQASGIVGGTNAVTGAINNGTSNALMYNYLQKQNPSAYSSSNAGDGQWFGQSSLGGAPLG
jgi:hypothetical protein